MLFGFADSDKTLLNTDEDDPMLKCVYYYGTNDDGARHTGWLRYEDGFDNEDYDDDYYWFYFLSDGKKKVDGTKKVNGKTYAFDEYGVMITEFTSDDGTSTSATPSQSKYYSDNLEDGSLKKSAWIRTSMPDSWEGLDGYDDDDHWFRTNSRGVLLTNTTKKINGKWYAFDSYGVMADGLVLLAYEGVSNNADTSNTNFIGYIDEDDWTADNIYNDITFEENATGVSNKGYLYYFSGDEEKDGSMKTGSSVKISLADDDYKFYFNKTTGQAIDGVKNNKLYRNGILQEASSDNKYEIAEDATNGYQYLVNTSGTVCKARRTYKDGNDTYFGVRYYNGKDATEGYTIGAFNNLADAKAYAES